MGGLPNEELCKKDGHKSANDRLLEIDEKLDVISQNIDFANYHVLRANGNIDFANHHIMSAKDAEHMALAIAKQHEKVFPLFKNIHKDKDFVILATGPTLSHYQPLEDVITIGINFAYNKGLKLDYWVSADILSNIKYLDYLKTAPFIKFFGQYAGLFLPDLGLRDEHGNSRVWPDRYIEDVENGYKFYLKTDKKEFTRDIETDALQNFTSSTFSALTIALYMGAKNIYLVGCDCFANGYFDEKHSHINRFPAEEMLETFMLFKEHIRIFYPSVEVISINPVGLKGIFTDKYMEPRGK